MKDPLKNLLQSGALPRNLFAANSRYYSIKTTTLKTLNGKTIIHLLRRFVPSPDQFYQIREHTVKQGDRTDNLAAQYHNDPEQFWLLCDANGVMRPEEITETIGKKLRITLPEGISGGSFDK